MVFTAGVYTGATLQNYNNELVKCVDDLKEKREEVNKAILKDVRRAARARPHRELFSGGRHTGPGRGRAGQWLQRRREV